MSKIVTRTLLSILGIAITVTALYFILMKIDMKSVGANLAKVNPLYPLGMAVTYLSTFPVRALRWRLILGSDYRGGKLMESLFLGFTFNNLLPARAGELVRVEHFSRWSGLSRITSLGSVLSEKVLDCIILLTLLTISGLIYSKNYSIDPVIVGGVELFGLALGLGILSIVFLHRNLEKMNAVLLTWKVPGAFQSFIGKIFNSFNFLSNGRNTFYIMVLSLVVWTLEACVFILGVDSISLDNAILIGTMTLCVVNFGILIPSSPGYIGVFQAAFIFSFSLFGLSDTDGLSASILVHSSQFFPVTLIGVTISLRNLLKRKKDPAPQD